MNGILEIMNDKVNPPTTGKRSYDATQRRKAARDTQRAIVAAARSTFIERGYTATTMAVIAESAGVALDTVYASVGRKPELFRLLIETAISGQPEPVSAEQRDYVRAIREAADPRVKIDLYAYAIGQIQARLAPLFRVLQEAARSDPDLAALWAEIADRRADNMRHFVTDVIDGGSTLPDGLTIDEAADLIWATNGTELYLLLVEDRGWPIERYVKHLGQIWTRLLLP